MVPRAILSLVIRRVLLVIIISFFFTVTREKKICSIVCHKMIH